MATAPAGVDTAHGQHFSCSMTAVLLARVHAHSGSQGIARLLQLAGSDRSPQYLSDIVNWISYDEAVALWHAGARVTHHPRFARMVGEDAVRRLNGSPTAALLRSLGSPERVYEQMATTATKYSVVSRLEALDVGPGFAEIVSTAVDGFPRSPDHCDWTAGLLTQPPILFGLPAARIEHTECAAFGAPACRYRVTWSPEIADGESARNRSLLGQLEAMKERLHSVFATASDLIGADDISDVLARITDRAAVEVRAPSYLLAIRPAPDAPVVCHHRGIDEARATEYAETVLSNHPAALPESWLVVPVRSSRRDYGRLLALYEDGRQFFAEERGLLEVYARYAASALDSATALIEARERYGQSSALLDLARALAGAGTRAEIVRRLAEAVPGVIDCDRLVIALWDAERSAFVERAVTDPVPSAPILPDVPRSWVPAPGATLHDLVREPRPDPIFIDPAHGDAILRQAFGDVGAVASLLVPLTTSDQLLGVLTVSVRDRPERLQPTQDLLDRLSGVAAQSATALQNGMLLDQITHRALHDDLTGLANRLCCKDRLREMVARARADQHGVTTFYVDLDRFKPVNDEFGHDAGDELLVQVARRLEHCIRDDDLVARLGGDEFAVLIDDGANPDGARLVGERLARAFADPFEVAGHRLTIGASVGRASFPADATEADALLTVADGAMFADKRARQPLPGARQTVPDARRAIPAPSQIA